MKPAHTTSIGLFGTCDNSKWREKFMECYEESDISYFNPDAGDDWHPGLIDDENKHLLEDTIILFPILSESLGLGSLAEIGFSVLNVIRNIEQGSNQHLIVLIDNLCTKFDTEEAERVHSNCARKLVKSKLLTVKHPNIMVVDSIDSMLIASLSLIDAIDAHEEVRWNFDISLNK